MEQSEESPPYGKPDGKQPFLTKDGVYLGKRRFQSEIAATRRRSFLGRRGERLTQWAFDQVKTLVGEGYVLDLACGNGRHLPGLLDITPRVLAADISLPMLLSAKSLPGASSQALGFFRLDAEMLPFRDNAFDVVFCARFFHHLPSAPLRAAILAEMFRVASRGVVLTFKSKHSYEGMTKRLKSRLFGRPLAWYYIDSREIARAALAHGWRVTREMASAPIVGSNRVVVMEPNR